MRHNRQGEQFTPRACIGRGESSRLRLIDGNQEVEIPITALRMLVDILAQMAEGNAVTDRSNPC